MKRYRLKKDLPTFKAGDTFHISHTGSLVCEKQDNIIAYAASTLEKFPNILEDWFEEVLDIPIVSKLANIEVAPEDYVDGEKRLFTWDEAMAVEEKLNDGWRLPTRSELALLAEEFGLGKNRRLDSATFMENLRMNYTGYRLGGSTYGTSTSAYYWSRTVYDNYGAYHLYFNSSGYLDPQSSDYKYLGFAIRLVRDLRRRKNEAEK